MITLLLKSSRFLKPQELKYNINNIEITTGFDSHESKPVGFFKEPLRTGEGGANNSGVNIFNGIPAPCVGSFSCSIVKIYNYGLGLEYRFFCSHPAP